MKHWNTRNLAVALATILLSCCASIGRTEAAVLLYEGFEDYPTGAPPSPPWDVTLPPEGVTMNVVDTFSCGGGTEPPRLRHNRPSGIPLPEPLFSY